MLTLFDDMQMDLIPIAVALWSKAWTVFARSNTRVMVSIPTWSMDMCVYLFCVRVVLCIVVILRRAGGLRNRKTGKALQQCYQQQQQQQ
jgi:hypothetical protein